MGGRGESGGSLAPPSGNRRSDATHKVMGGGAPGSATAPCTLRSEPFETCLLRPLSGEPLGGGKLGA